MPRDERRRQKALAKKAQRRKEKKAALHHAASAGHTSLRAAAHWPLYECLVSRSWQEPGELVQILVARSAGGEIAAAGILVDLGALGVKDALTHVLMPSEYEAFRRSFTSLQPMMRADLNLVAKIVEEGIAYAERLGFRPHRDYGDAVILLAGARPDECDTPIPLGVEGKPYYIPGPHDNISRVVRQLERAVGPGNFHYVLPLEALESDDLELEALEPDDPVSTAEIAAEEQEPAERRASFLPRLFRRQSPG